jgi:AcrR family transcriptional regulator
MTEPAVSSTPGPQPALTPRQQLKADRREALLAAAKHLIAKHGYLGVRLEDIGGAAGVSGPAVYRHFASKDAVLAALLVGISHTLRDGGQRVRQSAPSPSQALLALVAWQLDFALTEPELILIYDRDRFHLPPEDLQDVRRTQRAYVEIWVEVISAAAPSGRVEVDRTRAHAVIGLINSTPRIPGTSDPGQTREVLTRMALGALGLEARGHEARGLETRGLETRGLDPGGPRAGRPRR